MAHPAEFEWIFASPVGGAQHQLDSARQQAGLRFAYVLLDMLIELWSTRPFPVPALDEPPASLRGSCARTPG